MLANRKNSSSEAIIASQPIAGSRAIWRLSTARGECATSAWWWSSTSASTRAVPSSQGMTRSVARSGFIT